MKNVGRSVARIDAYDKVTGRCKYTDDLADKSALIVKLVHSTVANGKVLKIDTSEAEKIPGVVKIVTCFDAPKIAFPTAGHPWSVEKAHQDVADRYILTDRPLLYGDDIAAVIAEDEVSATQAVRLVKVEYEEYPFVLDVLESMKDGAPQLKEGYKNNILKHTTVSKGNVGEAIKEPGLILLDKWYSVPTVQHCHIENAISFAYEENGRITCVSSTQIPHIIRRICSQALGRPYGDIKIIKPYIGGGFGDKQDALYEPLVCFLTTQVGGRMVKFDVSREETFTNCRVRHGMKFHIKSWLRKDGTIVARTIDLYSDQGAYASHGHSIAAKAIGCFNQMYPSENYEGNAYTIFTNKAAAGAMRGYGIPQAMFGIEAHTEDVCKLLGIDPYEYRMKHIMPAQYYDPFSHNKNRFDSFRCTLEKGREEFGYDKIKEECRNQDPKSRIRRGVGVASFWYNTSVYPISLEISSSRMVLNQDGTIQLQVGETEIGQGADTAYAQMAGDAIGIDYTKVHVVSCQDTDVTPFGLGAYASRQTFVVGFSIKQTAEILRGKILAYAKKLTNYDKDILDIVDSNVVIKSTGERVISLSELAETATYNLNGAEHITAESSYQIHNNAYSFGCCFAEVEVDIDLCKVKVVKIMNVHDCGTLINPALAEAQVHGGMSMGIGYGTNEILRYDPKTGRCLNHNLLDYKISTIMDHPRLEARFCENAEPVQPFGTKALGEPPACPVAPAIRNAIMNAVGVAPDHLPCNSLNLFTCFKEAGLI